MGCPFIFCSANPYQCSCHRPSQVVSIQTDDRSIDLFAVLQVQKRHATSPVFCCSGE